MSAPRQEQHDVMSHLAFGAIQTDPVADICDETERFTLDSDEYLSSDGSDVELEARFQLSLKRKSKSSKTTKKVRSGQYHASTQMHKNLWRPRLSKYVAILRRLKNVCYIHRPAGASSSNQLLFEQAVDLLQILRKIPASVWKSRHWHRGLKDSQFGNAVFNLQFTHLHPSCTIPSDLVGLWRVCRIFDSLCCLLLRWSGPAGSLKGKPNAWETNWPWVPPRDNDTDTFMADDKGEHLLKIIMAFPDAIPLQVDPSSIFFLHSEQNFVDAYRDWLRFAMFLRGIKINKQSTEKDAKVMFAKIIQAIQSDEARIRMWQEEATIINQKHTSETPANQELLTVVFANISSFHTDKKKVKTLMKDYVATFKDDLGCEKCKDADLEERCVVHEYWNSDFNRPQIAELCNPKRPSGPVHLSKVPLEELYKQEGLQQFSFLNPDKLGLKRIGFSDSLRASCGKKLVYIYDEKREIVGFYAFSGLHPEVYAMMKQLAPSSSKKSTISRSKAKFRENVGQMDAYGARQPAGGAPGAAYGYYSAQTATNPPGLQELMDIAKKEMILREATRMYFPKIVRSLEANRDTDRLGRSGFTMYFCSGYVSPFHFDDDEQPAYCYSERWKACRETDDYAFVYGNYGLYFATESNCLWSFDGNEPHATLYPKLPPAMTFGNTSGRPQNPAPDWDNPHNADLDTDEEQDEDEDEVRQQQIAPQANISVGSSISSGVHPTVNRRSAHAAQRIRGMKACRYLLRSRYVLN